MSARRMFAAVLLLVACGEEEPLVTIADFESRSELVECARLDGDTSILASIVSARPVSDSTFMVADEMARQIVLFDSDARIRSITELPSEGPASVANLVDAAASGDSLYVAADPGSHRLVAVTPQGEQRWTIELAFPPQSVAYAGDRLLIAAFGMDPRTPGLLHEHRAGRVVSLGAPVIPHADAIGRTLANGLSLRGFPDGSAVAAHHFVWPRVWAVPVEGRPRAGWIPVADRAAEGMGNVPPIPMSAEDESRLAMPVLSFVLDPDNGDVFYVTRSGRRVDGRTEKAIVRASGDFSYLGSIRVSINAVHVIYLSSRPDSLIVSDDDLTWYRCPVPPRGTPA